MENHSERIDLGLVIAQALNPGKRLTCEEVAAYCDCTRNTLHRIEKNALAKVRRLLRREGIAGDQAEALKSLESCCKHV